MSLAGQPILVGGPEPEGDLVVRRARVFDPRAGIDEQRDVVVRDGAVAEIAAPGSADWGGEEIEADGLLLAPAFVDPHVHLRVPGQEHKEELETGTRAAAAGGFSAVLAMPNTDPVIDSGSILGALREAARRESRIPVGFLGAITVGQRGEELTAMGEMREMGAAGLTDDGRPVVGAGILRRALQYQRMVGGVLALHEEDPTLSAAGAMHEGRVSAELGVGGIPSVSESSMIARDALIAGYEDGAIHCQHLSSAESVAAVAAAKESGIRITCEASPHHLCFTDEDVRTLDTRMKMNPPLRAESDRQALIEGLRSGVIDCIATDHAPHAPHEKEGPFEQAPMGTTGLESAFAACYDELVVPGLLPLGVLLERMNAGAAIFGLPTPSITPGSPADLVLIDLDREWVVGADGYESRSDNCAFGGRRLTGRVLMTIAGGAVAYRDRAFALGPVPDQAAHR